MFRYSYNAYFISSLFNVSILNPAISTAVAFFNSLPRKVGYKKHIVVNVNHNLRCLSIDLESDIPLAPVNYLRAAQYFSKVLALQPGMGNYIVNGRLLVK